MKGPSQLAAYSDLFARLGDITFLVEPGSLKILEANPATERTFRVPADSLVGESILQWINTEDREDFSKVLRVAMRRYHPRQYEVRWNILGNNAFMDLMICPLQLSDGSQVLQIIARDITFRHEAELKMSELVKKLEEANGKLQILSTTDELTDLHNVRYFKQKIEEEHVRAVRYQQIYSVIFIDIDHFKHYNDRNGHPAGDKLLKEVAQNLKDCTRNTDFCARYGGEEFVILCPAVDSNGAKVAAERIRKNLEEQRFAFAEHQPMGHLSVSIGVADYPTHGKNFTEILERADQALYYSKKHGRNRVTLFTEIAHLPVQNLKKVA